MTHPSTCFFLQIALPPCPGYRLDRWLDSQARQPPALSRGACPPVVGSPPSPNRTCRFKFPRLRTRSTLRSTARFRMFAVQATPQSHLAVHRTNLSLPPHPNVVSSTPVRNPFKNPFPLRRSAPRSQTGARIVPRRTQSCRSKSNLAVILYVGNSISH